MEEKELLKRRNEFIETKKKNKTLKISNKPLQKYELEVETYDKAPGESGDHVTPHHMPSAESMKNKVEYGECSCLNVLEETHEATFTYGMGGKRKGDKALYESLSDEKRLEFDNEDLINAYKVTRPNVNLDEVKVAVEKQNKHSKKIIDGIKNKVSENIDEIKDKKEVIETEKQNCSSSIISE